MNISAIDKIEQNLNGLFETAERYLGAVRTMALKAEYKAKKEESLLQVMLFGSYNAGKSSLINALVMEEVAAIGDIPKTATADRYHWNGCYLLDTPGVNAPIEHEALTDAQIDRSELILFVIRQGDQDVKDVYERMFSMLARDKQIFIVYNHELAPEALPEALARLTDIMAQYAASHQIDLQRVGEIPVLPVNIKTAMKARLKGSELLAEHSGIVHFETVFLSWLRRFDNDYHYLDRLRKHIHQCLVTPSLKAIADEANGDETAELKNLQYQRDEVIRQYALLDSQVANHVRAEIVRSKPEIASIMNRSTTQVELESEILQLADKVVSSTSGFLQQRCESVTNEMNATVDISIETRSGEGRSHIRESIEQALVTGAKNIDSNTLKEGFLLLRKLKIPGIKGRWEKTLGQWANKANWTVTVLVSAYEIYSASAEQDKKNEEQQRQTLTLHQLIESIASDIGSAILDESRKLISSSKEQSLTDLDASIKKITESSEQHIRDREYVKSLASGLDAVQV
ncbi:GTPase [Vreelandella neptunia]|uniref:GTPase n=1 Tax=Vreelandella neptunia TaxID=115551 RepID=A0ABZ0YJE6_9GAMM|nr:GTPase [Halomonas neptunia]MDN3562081.1 50S ribosome-binding GTPase [Halomonas neptunia]WQH11784.1 GTPase [Halomonas neptunia]